MLFSKILIKIFKQLNSNLIIKGAKTINNKTHIIIQIVLLKTFFLDVIFDLKLIYLIEHLPHYQHT